MLAIPAVLAFGLAVAGCGSDTDEPEKPAGGDQHKSQQTEDIADRLGKSCDDDTMGVKQGRTTIWCDPDTSSATKLVWVDASGHSAAEKVKREAAAKEAAAQKKAAEKAEREAAAKKQAEQKAAAERSRKAEADRAAEAERMAANRRRAEAQRKAAEERGRQLDKDVFYKNCDAVRAAGAAPIHRGDAGYAQHLDRDGDGVGCE